MIKHPRAAGRDQSPRHGLHVQHVGVVQSAVIIPAVDHDLMTDGGSGISLSRAGSGAARFGFGPSVGGEIKATKEIVYVAFALISDETPVAFGLIRAAGEEEKFRLAMMTPALQVGSW